MMRKIILSTALLFGFLTSLSAQTPPPFETGVAEVLAAHRATALSGLAVQMAGTIEYPVVGSRSFTLGALGDRSRFELATPSGSVIIVRQGRRIQTTRSGRREPPDGTSLSTSSLNFAPVLLLLALHGSELFTGSLVIGQDGTRHVRFTETWPARFAPPPFPQPGQIIQFELDSNSRIVSVRHGRTDLDQWRFFYRYEYLGLATAPFVQPSRIVAASDDRNVSTVSVTSVTSGIVLAADYFRIYEWGRGN